MSQTGIVLREKTSSGPNVDEVVRTELLSAISINAQE